MKRKQKDKKEIYFFPPPSTFTYIVSIDLKGVVSMSSLSNYLLSPFICLFFLFVLGVGVCVCVYCFVFYLPFWGVVLSSHDFFCNFFNFAVFCSFLFVCLTV